MSKGEKYLPSTKVSRDQYQISGNSLEGIDVEEGDVFIGVKNVFNFVKPDINPSAIVELVDRYRDLPEHNDTFVAMREELEGYRKPKPNREIIGLQNKLHDGGRDDLLENAVAQKSDANSRLTRFEFSSHATAMHLTVMTKIEEKFNSIIIPMLKDGVTNLQIDQAISSQIIEPLAEEVRLADITLTPKKIRGMMFILTGNCYLKWSR